jgi:DNA-3-methyladenine glycosylase II
MDKPSSPLNAETFALGLSTLSERDPDLARILQILGPPPMWARDEGFATLIQIILEQQVSLASAKAAFDRLSAAVLPLTPAGFLALDDATLKAIGFSRQKAGYGRHLAEAIVAGRFDPDALRDLDDDAARAALVSLKGIGPWSADIYLLMALRRPDVWPAGDLALAQAAQRAKGLSCCPSPKELEALATPWRPWRAVAARLLWHLYLSGAKAGFAP